MDEFWTRHEQDQYSQRMADEHHRQNRRIEILEENYAQLTELTLCVKTQTMTLDAMSKKVDKQGEQIDKIVNEPVKQAHRIKEKAIDTAVGIVVGALVVGIVLLIAQYII